MKIDFNLKHEQEEALRHIFNLVVTICILPTGFRKSIIYQLLPCMMQMKHGVNDTMIVFVVAPMNSIMEDQIKSLSSNATGSSFEDFISGSESSGDDDHTQGW
jgi:superfamily II DNA helicase RecQ